MKGRSQRALQPPLCTINPRPNHSSVINAPQNSRSLRHHRGRAEHRALGADELIPLELADGVADEVEVQQLLV